MIMFGAIYYIMPAPDRARVGLEQLIRIHFWSTAVRHPLMFLVPVASAGMVQGFEMNQASDSLSSLDRQHGFFGGIDELFGGFTAQQRRRAVHGDRRGHEAVARACGRSPACSC